LQKKLSLNTTQTHTQQNQSVLETKKEKKKKKKTRSPLSFLLFPSRRPNFSSGGVRTHPHTGSGSVGGKGEELVAPFALFLLQFDLRFFP